jgi:hypothetical protein
MSGNTLRLKSAAGVEFRVRGDSIGSDVEEGILNHLCVHDWSGVGSGQSSIGRLRKRGRDGRHEKWRTRIIRSDKDGKIDALLRNDRKIKFDWVAEVVPTSRHH